MAESKPENANEINDLSSSDQELLGEIAPKAPPAPPKGAKPKKTPSKTKAKAAAKSAQDTEDGYLGIVEKAKAETPTDAKPKRKRRKVVMLPSKAAIHHASEVWEWMVSGELDPDSSKDQAIAALAEKFQMIMGRLGTSTEVLSAHLGKRCCEYEHILAYARDLMPSKNIRSVKELSDPDINASLKSGSKQGFLNLLRYLDQWRRQPSSDYDADA